MIIINTKESTNLKYLIFFSLCLCASVVLKNNFFIMLNIIYYNFYKFLTNKIILLFIEYKDISSKFI